MITEAEMYKAMYEAERGRADTLQIEVEQLRAEATIIRGRKAKDAARKRHVRGLSTECPRTPPLVSSFSPIPPITTSLPPQVISFTTFKKLQPTTSADVESPILELSEERPTASKSATTSRPTLPKKTAAAGGGFAWMGRIRGVFKAIYGVEPEARGWGKLLKPQVDRLGEDVVVAELEAYCRMTLPMYLNAHKFADLCGGWQKATDQWEDSQLPPKERQARAHRRKMDAYYDQLEVEIAAEKAAAVLSA